MTLIERGRRERIVLVGVAVPPATLDDAESSLDELTALVDTAGADAVERILQRRDHPDPATFVGKGKAEELREISYQVDADTVVFDEELTPAQSRNLEKILGRTAIDRTAVILDIFAQHAHSQEGKAQVELAMLRYRLPRLRGRGKALSQQAGGIGTRRGPGETQLEVDRRRLVRRVTKLEADLRVLTKNRRTQRKARARSRLQTVALVGYTNAGKSTILNRLTDAGVLVEDRLFATVDPTTRRLELPGGERVLLSDTVGFVRKLPTQLVEAFRSTLEEVAEADLLVHVVDASAADPEAQMEAVHTVLREIGADEVPELRGLQQVGPGRTLGNRRGGQAPARPPPGLGGPVGRHRGGGRGVAGGDGRAAAHAVAHRGDARALRAGRRGGGPAPPGRGAHRGPRARRHPAAGPPARPRGQPLRRLPGVTAPTATGRPGFEPPPYPYDRLDRLKPLAGGHEGGLVDLSIGTPCDPPPPEVVAALSSSGAERGYPSSIGTPAFRDAAAGWMRRRLGVDVPVGDVAACIGTKELVTALPQWLHLRHPDRDTVLYPAVSYPSYAMGATLAGCRAVPVDIEGAGVGAGGAGLAAVDPDDAARALCLWVNSPGNPTGALTDLGAAAAWGRAHGVPVLSDECYVEFTWADRPRTILEHGAEGVLAVHSLSKRSNLAGLRAGFYAGDVDLVHYLSEVRKHAGAMVPGPVQAAAVVAFGDDIHVDAQRERYAERMAFFREVLAGVGAVTEPSAGSFYLWAAAPGGDAWGLTSWLAEWGGVLVAPGDLYGSAGAGHVRVALVQSMDRLRLVADRLRRAPAGGRQSG